MTLESDPWSIRLSRAAETDFREIVEWTIRQFGPAQARVYADILAATLEELGRGPNLIGVKTRDDIAEGLFTLHIARKSRRGRHFVLFRVIPESQVIDVLRLLHDAMDLPHYLPDLGRD